MLCMGDCKNKKTWFVSAAALFVATMAYDWYIHGTCLKELYEQTKRLWRPEAEMQAIATMWCPIYHGILAILIAMFYGAWRNNQKMGAVGSANCPYKKSILGFGLWIGLFTGTIAAAGYIWMPIPAELAQAWFVAEVAKGVLIGIILNFVHSRYEVA